MNVVFVNSCTYGSTGTIATELSQTVRADGGQACVCVPGGRHLKGHSLEHVLPIGGRLSEDMHVILGRLTGAQGCFSAVATRRFVKRLAAMKPDILHLHNLHNSYIHLPILFEYIKAHDVRVVWTFHDCWPFTGHCPYFDLVGCEKWKTQCGNCSQYRQYPQSFVDHSAWMYRRKAAWFTGVKHMTLVTPSHWLGKLVGQSFLKDYPVKVIHNGIDLSVFRPVSSDFRATYHCENKHIVLGVAFGWEKRKGLDVFLELFDRLGKDYQIVLVGTDEAVDRQLPEGIVSIHRTQNREELAQIYTAADVLVNPTREENYPTVNMEAIACGTPVVTFDTGGCAEIVDATSGCVVAKNDVNAMLDEIVRVCTQHPFSENACVEAARHFDKHTRHQDYMTLYRSLL